MAYLCIPSQTAHHHETHVPALQPQAPQQARVPFSYGNGQWKGRFEPPQSQGPQEAFGFERTSPQGLIAGILTMPTHQGQPSLRGHGAFDKVFGEGKSFFLFPFQFRFKEPDDLVQRAELPQLGIRLGISVPKRRFKRAVDRNLIRRRIREAFRLNRQHWHDAEQGLSGGAAIVLVYSTNEILDFDRIQESVRQGMQRWSRSHRS